MNCIYCGFELEEGAKTCPNCGEEKGKVQVLTPEERENFQGLTIGEEPEPRDDGYYEYKSADGRRRVYVRQVNLGGSPIGGSLAGILTFLFIGAVILFLVIIALPFALFGIGILVLGWLLSGIRKR